MSDKSKKIRSQRGISGCKKSAKKAVRRIRRLNWRRTLADMLNDPLEAEALHRLIIAASNREHTMGDPLHFLECQAELRAATKAARALIELR